MQKADDALRRQAKDKARRSAETLTDAEDAAITAAAEADPDNPLLDENFWRRAKPLDEARLQRLQRKRVKQPIAGE